jgi:hypothetical protein
MHTHPRRGVIRKVGAAGATAVLMTAMAMTGAFASHPTVTLTGSNFEIDTDANLTVEHASPSKDWGNVSQVRATDTPSGASDESFGQGTKEDTAAPTVVDGSIPPNKSDLKFFGVYQEGDTSTGFLNLYWSRVQDPQGTTNMDFEFNKRQCTPGASPADADCSANGITPIRSADDLLITYDLSKGGTVPNLSIREWTGSAWGTSLDLSASNKAAGSINTTAIAAADADDLGAHSPRTFGEAQIALSAIFGSDCTSFGSVYLKSRASDSFTAALKDFVPPKAVDIRNCGKLNIVKVDDATPAAPLVGAVFTLYNNVAPLAGPRDVEAPDLDAITSPALTCTTVAAGTCTIDNIPVGNYWVVETTVPSGHTQAPDQATTVTSTSNVTLTFVDPRIILQPTISTAQSWVPNDSATVAVAAGQGDLAGSVRFRLYDNASCTGTELHDQTVLISTGTGSGLQKTVSTSNTTAYTSTKTFSWLVEYTSTKDVHRNVTSICDDEHTVLTINNDYK